MWIPGWRRAAAAAGWWLGVSVLLFLLMWPAGLLAGALEDPVDWPVFRWSQGVFPGVEPWWSINDAITRMGNTTQTRIATVVGAVGLTVLWWRRRIRLPWLPLAVLPAAYVTAHYLQIWSADLVDRGHPPTTLGTWPSGGVARTILTYGLICYCLLLALGVRRTLAWTWVFAATIGAVESWTRIHTLRHWFTDVIGGYLFGVALLALALVAVRIVTSRAAEPAPTPSPAPTAPQR